MERLYKQGEIETPIVNIGDIIEISIGVFIKVKEIRQITEEEIAGTKKTNVYIKGEIVSNGK
jgi:hypothetical protein